MESIEWWFKIPAHLFLCSSTTNLFRSILESKSSPSCQCKASTCSRGNVMINFEYSTSPILLLNLFCSFNYFNKNTLPNKLRHLNLYIVRCLIQYMIGSRENRGKIIAQKQNQIIRIDNNHYKVNSQSRNKQHDIISLESGWSCSCEDHYFRKTCCQHIHAVEFSLQLREQVKQQVTIQEVNMSCCKFCNSENFTKWGIRHNKNYDIQIFKCKDCSKKFSMNLGFEGLKAKPEMVTASMNLYFNGESTRHVADSMKLFGTKITHVTVQNWIKKYVRLMEKYLELITPKVSEKWRTDEIYLKIKGDRKYLYALMDDETRYWIAKQVSDHKYTQDVPIPMSKDCKSYK